MKSKYLSRKCLLQPFFFLFDFIRKDIHCIHNTYWKASGELIASFSVQLRDCVFDVHLWLYMISIIVSYVSGG